MRDGKLHIKPTLTADQYGEDFLSSGVINLNGGAPADAYVYFISFASVLTLFAIKSCITGFKSRLPYRNTEKFVSNTVLRTC